MMNFSASHEISTDRAVKHFKIDIRSGSYYTHGTSIIGAAYVLVQRCTPVILCYTMINLIVLYRQTLKFYKFHTVLVHNISLTVHSNFFVKHSRSR